MVKKTLKISKMAKIHKKNALNVLNTLEKGYLCKQKRQETHSNII